MSIHFGKHILKGLAFESNATLDERNAVKRIRIQNKAANYTVLPSDSGTTFTTYGGANGMTFTLPIVPTSGLTYRFIDSTANTVIVAAANADTFMVYADANGDSVSITDIGVMLEVIADGNQWVCVSFGTGSNDLTATVAT